MGQLRGQVRNAMGTNEYPEDGDDADVMKAYDNASAYDNQSQISGRVSAGGGNGNPNRLPGLGGGPGRQRVPALGLEKNHSSASRVGQVNYADHDRSN